MSTWLKIQNNSKINLLDIPVLKMEELRKEIIREQKRPVAFFGKDWGNDRVRLFVVLADAPNLFPL